MKTKLLIAILGFTAASGTGTALAADAKPAQSCFFISQFENWKAPDAKTIYIRVNMNRYYRLDLSAPCSQLTWPGSHLITKTRGSTSVCSALDWDLSVSDSGGLRGGAFRQHCIVKAMTPLSDADVAAIPKKFRP